MNATQAPTDWPTHSDSIKNLVPALIAAQQKFAPAIRTAVNPYHNSKYVDLASAIDCVQAALAENGLTIIQGPDVSPTGPVLISTLAHTSGEWARSRYPLKPVKDDPQGMGAATTYARRYSLMALVGIAPEDDDGETASGRVQEQRRAQTSTQNQGSESIDVAPHRDAHASPAQRELYEWASESVENANKWWHEKHPDATRALANKWQLHLHLRKWVATQGWIDPPDHSDPKRTLREVAPLWAEHFQAFQEETSRYLFVELPARRPESKTSASSRSSTPTAEGIFGLPLTTREQMRTAVVKLKQWVDDVNADWADQCRARNTQASRLVDAASAVEWLTQRALSKNLIKDPGKMLEAVERAPVLAGLDVLTKGKVWAALNDYRTLAIEAKSANPNTVETSPETRELF